MPEPTLPRLAGSDVSRRDIFRRRLSVPETFHRELAHLPSHQFLRNPSGCAPYLYLVEYVAQMSQSWWAQPASELALFDWGCGKGQVSYLLGKHGFTPTCADVVDGPPEDRRLLDLAGFPMVALDHPYELPFPSDHFHTVVSFGVLEHVPDDRASLKEIYRVLKPEGLFFCFNLPRMGSWIMWMAHGMGNHYHDRLYTSRGTRSLLEKANFTLIDMWRRQLFPKNRVRYPFPHLFERLDQWLCERTPLRYLSTSLEFVACKDPSS